MHCVRDDQRSTADRIRAIHLLRHTTSTRLGPELIRLLDHPDGGLRHYAWTQLESILGRRLAYRPYGPPSERRKAKVLLLLLLLLGWKKKKKKE